MPIHTNKPGWIAGTLLALALGAIFVARRQHARQEERPSPKEALPVPVEVVPVQRGPLARRRTFSGTIEARAESTVAPKVGGRIQRLSVDIADRVTRGQTVAQLEDAEFKQAVVEAQAGVAVAEANRIEAENRLEIAQRTLDRTKALHTGGIASESVLDAAQAEFLAGQAAVKVAEARLKREAAALAAAEIRFGYTRIQANWERGDAARTVAERYADEGNTVAANTPLFSIVELDPAIAVLQVTEKDYPRIAAGQHADLRLDAFPGQVFTGTVSRIAPVFRASSRQARVELNVPNPTHQLKPGMFTRCTLVLDRVEDTASVPELAITRRNNRSGVFLVNGDGTSVTWVEVEPGLQDGEQVELVGSRISGQVVTLGQQLIEDGSAIHIAAPPPPPDGGTATP